MKVYLQLHWFFCNLLKFVMLFLCVSSSTLMSRTGTDTCGTLLVAIMHHTTLVLTHCRTSCGSWILSCLSVGRTSLTHTSVNTNTRTAHTGSTRINKHFPSHVNVSRAALTLFLSGFVLFTLFFYSQVGFATWGNAGLVFGQDSGGKGNREETQSCGFITGMPLWWTLLCFSLLIFAGGKHTAFWQLRTGSECN